MMFEMIMGGYLFVLAVCDMFTKSVYIWLLAIGGIPAAISFVFEADGITLPQRAAGLGLGLVILIAAKLSKEKIGYGDGAVLCVIGISLGIYTAFFLTAVSLFLLLAYSIAMLARGRLGRKSRVPFIPFVFAGYVLMQFA